MNIHSRVHFYICKDDTSRHVITTSNLFTNAGIYDWLRGSLGTRLAIGEGTRVEVPEVSRLDNLVQSSGGSYTVVDSNNYDAVAGTVTSTIQLDVLFPVQSEANNYTEFGIFDTSVDRLQTYALIRGPQGDPVVLTAVPGERVRVLYEIDFVVPASTVLDTVIAEVPTRVTQVVLNNTGSSSRRLPEAVGYLRTTPMPNPPAPLQPIEDLVGRTTGNYVEDTLNIDFEPSAGSSAEGVSVVTAGVGLQLAWHFDPPVQKGNKTFKFNYTHNLGGADA